MILFKWLMVFIPPVTVAVGHAVLQPTGGRHGIGRPVEYLIVTFVALVLAYLFAEAMFGILRRLEAEAWAQEQDILTMNAVMRERERLSRELHDGAAQLVAHLLLRLDTIRELVAAGRRQDAEAELERLHGVADEIYVDIAESIAGIRANVAERGLIGTLQEYVDQYEERHQIPVRLRVDAAADRLGPLIAFQLFRLIQEALTNVRKHAEARQVAVTLTPEGSDRLSVVIADDGRGFIAGGHGQGKARPLGMTSMRERVEALGGAFSVSSQPGAGTRVTASIPIPRTRKERTHAALAAPPG